MRTDAAVPPIHWTIIVPLKRLPGAKSRLAERRDPLEHARLVDAIRADTLAVAAMAGRVFVVFDRELPDPPSSEQYHLVQSGTGLNEALIEADAVVRRQWPGDHVAALVGDLPSLRPEELQAALARAGEHPQAFVADASGEGTTLLTAAGTVRLAPAFGPNSAARHARFAHIVAAGPGLRLDVDTAADLEQARALGLGPATTAVLHEIEGRRRSP